MKLSALKNVRVDRLSSEQVEDAYRTLKAAFSKSSKAFSQRGLEPEPLRYARERLEEIPSSLTGISRKQAEVSAMRNFFFTKPPGATSERRAITSTVSGYKSVLRQTGRTLGIRNYASGEWSEQQRRDLWERIDRVRELGPDRFLPNGFGNAMYQSGRSFKTVSVIINDLNIDDPVQILEMLDQRINAVVDGNTMTDRQFFGL